VAAGAARRAAAEIADSNPDFTVSVPESVSTLRAVADAGTQALIVHARSDVGGADADSGLRAR